MEGSNEGVSEATNRIKNLFRNNKEDGMIREERDNENINKEDTVGTESLLTTDLAALIRARALF